MKPAEKITEATKRLNHNRFTFLLLYLFAGLSFIVAVALSSAIISKPLSLVATLLLSILLAWFLYKKNLFNKASEEDGAALLDKFFNTKERFSTWLLLSKSKADTETDSVSKFSLISEQLAAFKLEGDLAELIPLKLNRTFKTLLALLPLLWLLNFYLIYNLYFTPSLLNKELNLIASLTKDAQVPEELKAELSELKEALAEYSLTEPQVLAALARAETELERAMTDLELEAKRESLESDAELNELVQKEQDLPPSGAGLTPTPTPVPLAEAEKQKKKDQEKKDKEDREKKDEERKDKEKKSQDAESKDKQSEKGDKSNQGQKGKEDKEAKADKEQGQKGESGDGEGKGQGKGKGKSGGKQGQAQDGNKGDNDDSKGEGKAKAGSSGKAGAADSKEKQDNLEAGADSKAKQQADGEKSQGEKQAASGAAGDKKQDSGQSGSKQEALDRVAKALKELDNAVNQAKKDKQQQQGQDSGQNKDKSKDANKSDQQQNSDESKKDEAEKNKGKDNTQGKDKSKSRENQSQQKDPGELKREQPQSNQTAPGLSSMPGNSKEKVKRYSDDAKKGGDLGADKNYEERMIGNANEKIDSRFVDKEGKRYLNEEEAKFKTTLSEVELAKPKPIKDRSKQPIPLEYRDILK